MATPAAWNSTQPYYPGNTATYAATIWLANTPNRNKRPDLYTPDIWTNQGGSGGGGGGGVTAVTVQGAGLANIGTAANVILKNTGVVGLVSGNPATLSISGPDPSYNFTLTNLAQAPLVAGYGISVAGDIISNTGVASLTAGTNCSVVAGGSNSYTINNTATGTLTAGTGIQIAGNVISNTGVTSIVAAQDSTTATNNGNGSWTVAAALSQPMKYLTGSLNPNVNIPNDSQYHTLATINLPQYGSTGIYMTNSFAGIAFCCLVSMFGPSGGGQMIVRLLANDIVPSPDGIYPLSAIPTNYSYMTFAIADSRTLPVSLNFLMSAGSGGSGTFTQYTSNTRSFVLQAAIINVSGHQSATWNPSNSAYYQLVGIN